MRCSRYVNVDRMQVIGEALEGVDGLSTLGRRCQWMVYVKAM